MSTVFIATATKEGLDWGSSFNESRLKDWCKEHIGKQLRLSPIDPKRSLTLNARYWAYLNDVEEQTGNLATDLHEIGKRKFLRPKFIKVEIDGKAEEIRIPASTSDLKSGEFMEYMDKFVAWTGIAQRTREELGYLPN